MNDDFVQYMHDNGWPIWVIAAVLFFLATGRSIVNAGSVLFNRKRREQDSANVASALAMAQQAIDASKQCETAHEECRAQLTLVRIDSEANRARIDELTARIDSMSTAA